MCKAFCKKGNISYMHVDSPAAGEEKPACGAAAVHTPHFRRSIETWADSDGINYQ
jgi:hypothetical protein